MLKGFWELCAAYKYEYRLMDMSKAAVVWFLLLVVAFVWATAELSLWLLG